VKFLDEGCLENCLQKKFLRVKFFMLGEKRSEINKSLIILLNKIIINFGKSILKIGNTL